VFYQEKHLPFNGRQAGDRREVGRNAGTDVKIISKVGSGSVLVVGSRDGWKNTEGSISGSSGNGCAPSALKLNWIVVLEATDRKITSSGRGDAYGNVNRNKIALVGKSWRSIVISVLMIKMREEI
jgi:hypothetical protein